MKPERFKQLFHAAAEIAPEHRDEFLRRACGADEALLEEVQTLLAANSGLPERSEPVTAQPALLIGRTFGSYHVKSLLGEGGMGAVYRAWDSRLKRDVAIKVLPGEFSRDSDRIARFQREAEILASLNHPHIAAIYDVAYFEEFRFLVLELVEGETLTQRITRGSLSVEDALRIAAQVAEALEAAHEIGIVHRDLKPANIKIKPDGKITLGTSSRKLVNDRSQSSMTATVVRPWFEELKQRVAIK